MNVTDMTADAHPPREDRADIGRLRAAAFAHEVELRRALERLERQVRDRVALGPKLAEHPEAVVVGGFLLGLWLGVRR
jgi:hypothetical protein